MTTTRIDTKLPSYGRWRYSQRRLEELDRLLAAVEAAAEALDLGGPRAEAPRFRCRADEKRYDELERQWKWLYTERQECEVAVDRRRNRRKYGMGLRPPEVRSI